MIDENHTLNVLLVEDSADDAELILRALRKGGFVIVQAERVETADGVERALGRQEWDAILCDYSLPRFNGLEALKIVHRIGRDLPFLIVSGAIGEETAVALMRAGAHDYIMKDKLSRLVPALKRELAEAVMRRERWQNRQALERELNLNAELAELGKLLVSAAEEIGPVAMMVLDKAKKLTGSQHGYVGLVDPRNGNLVALTLSEMRGEQCRIEGKEVIFPPRPDGSYGGLWGHALNARLPFYENSPAGHPASVGVPAGHIPLERFLSAPVIYSDQLVGQIALANPLSDYTDEDLSAVVRIADLYALAIHRVRSREEREKLAGELRQAQKLEAIGTLAGGIAHDFNNILTAVMGYTELSLMIAPPEANPLRANLEQILGAGKRAKRLIEQILTFTRRREQERKPLQVHLVVNEAMKLLRSTIPSTIEFRLDLNKESGAVLADPTQIYQVVMNLCTNAYHAMRNTGGTLNVSLAPCHLDSADIKVASLELLPGEYVKLSVCDTGCGMDRATMERIFEPYFTTKEPGEGTGLGLSVVHGIVKSHSGHVTAYSELGKGTVFNIYLPRCDSGSDEEGVDAVPIIGGNERILFVDDDEQIAYLGQQLLQTLGYQVRSFTDSGKAWQAFEAHPDLFELVITDMTMPHLDGAKLAQKILALRPKLPVILCSGYSETINELKAKDLGVREYMLKPLSQRELAKVVRRMLDEKRKP